MALFHGSLRHRPGNSNRRVNEALKALQLGASIKRVLALNRAFSAEAFELYH
jgi:hypothetical protein